VAAWDGAVSWRDVLPYTAAQLLGAVAGTLAANLMFGLPIISASTRARGGAAPAFSEFIATFGLLTVIWGCSRSDSSATAVGVGSYITAAYWFTASTSFANPAVTIARSLSNTFSGIRPTDVPGFVAAQLLGAFAATAAFRCWGPARVPSTGGAPPAAPPK
jgi:glycerol uptake facilitator-like aquaporin